MKAELIGKNISYNMLGCPHCSNLLYDSLNLYERNKEYKTVACTCCDFIGVRKSYVLLSFLTFYFKNPSQRAFFFF